MYVDPKVTNSDPKHKTSPFTSINLTNQPMSLHLGIVTCKDFSASDLTKPY